MSYPKTLAQSLKPVFKGFRRLDRTEQTEYLKYLNLVIERERSKQRRGTLLRFKAKLEMEMKLSMDKFKCFRHNFQAAPRRCWLCEAKFRSKGDTEKARRLYVKNEIFAPEKKTRKKALSY